VRKLYTTFFKEQ